jgi:hypothetical protein
MFELIYNENPRNLYKLPILNLRRPYSQNVYPILSLAQPAKNANFQKKLIDDNRNPIVADEKKNFFPNREKDLSPEPDEKTKKNNIYYILKQNICNSIGVDFEPFQKDISRILSNLSNWELIGDKDVKINCKALKFVGESKICGIMLEKNNIEMILKIIESEDIPKSIQMTCVRKEKDMSMCKKYISSLEILLLNLSSTS